MYTLLRNQCTLCPEYSIYLKDDSIHSTNEAVIAIIELNHEFGLGYDNEESIALMQETHFLGKAKLASGSYKKMNQMKLVLNEKGFSAFIEKNEK